MEVGVRELKTHLSRFLALVREGQPVVVTDRGKPIARITPVPTEKDLPARLQQLIAEGRVTYKPGPVHLPTPIKMRPGKKTAVDYVLEQRR